MTSIKPPGGPRGVGGPSGPDHASGTEKPTGPSFKDRVAEQRGTTGASAASDPSHTVVADLRAGKITPNEAVKRLTDLAVQKSHAPASMRPAVEARMRELLRSDPMVGDLLRRMGATVDSEPE